MRILFIACALMSAGFSNQPSQPENQESKLLIGMASSHFVEKLGEPDHKEKRLLGIGNRYRWGEANGKNIQISDLLGGRVDSITVERLTEVESIESVDWGELRVEAMLLMTSFSTSKPQDWILKEVADRKIDSIWISESTGNEMTIILTKDRERSLAGYLATLSIPSPNQVEHSTR